MNSSPALSLPLGLYTQNGNWLWRSGTGTGSLNAVKCRFTYSKLSSMLTLMNVKLFLLIGNWFSGTGRWRTGIMV